MNGDAAQKDRLSVEQDIRTVGFDSSEADFIFQFVLSRQRAEDGKVWVARETRVRRLVAGIRIRAFPLESNCAVTDKLASGIATVTVAPGLASSHGPIPQLRCVHD